jgi:hypothetical protein
MVSGDGGGGGSMLKREQEVVEEGGVVKGRNGCRSAAFNYIGRRNAREGGGCGHAAWRRGDQLTTLT